MSERWFEMALTKWMFFSSIISLSGALPWPGAVPTAPSYDAAQDFPRPTSSPEAWQESSKRTATNRSICGWLGSNGDLPATCGGDSSCFFDDANKVVACCPASGSCNSAVYTGCVDVDHPQTDVNENIYTCTGDKLCYRNTYPGGYHQYGCGASSDATTVATTYAGQTAKDSLNIVYTTIPLGSSTLSYTFAGVLASATSSSSSSTPSTSSTSKTSPTVMVTPLAVPIQAASPTSSAAAATGSSSATQMTSATISGVAVGSVAGVAVIAILIAFCYRQRRKKIERLQNLQIQTHMLVQSKASIFASRNSSQTSNFWEHPKQMAHAKSPHFQANGTENGQGAMEYAISPQSPVVPVRLANCLFDHRSLEEFSLDDEDEEPPPPPASVQGLSPPSRSPMRPDRTRESGQPVAFLGQAPEANRTFSHHSNDPDNVSVAHPRFDFESDDEPESEYEQYGGYAVGEIGGLLRFGNQLGKDPDLALSLANKKSIGSFMIPNTLAGGPFPASGLNQRRYFPENREEDKHELEGTLPMQSNEAQNQVPILRKPIPRQGRGGGRIYVP